MGTNYYFLEKPAMDIFGKAELRHIGKSSMGWCFGLHVYPKEKISTWHDWLAYMENHPISRIIETPIVDEYEEKLTIAQFIPIVTERKAKRRDWEKPPTGYASWRFFHEDNHSKKGPRGLLRHHEIGHCIGNGDGTWDYLIGDFS